MQCNMANMTFKWFDKQTEDWNANKINCRIKNAMQYGKYGN